ncbi:MAG TPA: sensor domain-containing diguanylate cyclase [bacterium]|nr:sensor domain-containing diguanylate cyclase [bacterium]HPS31087.1 sensor domain-containing diguanylate cyclase [bacterium]
MHLTEKFLTELLDTLFEAVYFTDNERMIFHWNKAAELLTGFSRDEIAGHRCHDNMLVHVDGEGNSLCTGNCPLLKAIQSKKPNESEIYLHHKDGHRVPVYVRIMPLFNEKGDVTGAIEVFTNSSSRIELTSQIGELKQLSMHDTLTGIPNRRYAEKIILDRIDEMNRFGWRMGLIFFDIDKFKHINDSYSHSTGDKMLKMIANTLRESIRSVDFISRWGGEEFVVILRNVTVEQLTEKAELLRKLVKESFFFENNTLISATISGGATMLIPGDTVESVIERADRLMYGSKNNGRNRITLG